MREVYKEQYGDNPEKGVAEGVYSRNQFASEKEGLVAHDGCYSVNSPK